MICQRCNHEGGEKDQFCSACGAFLRGAPTLQELAAALKAEFGDRELIENASALAVIDKVWSWLKVVGGLASVLLLLGAFVLGYQIHDLNGLADKDRALLTSSYTQDAADLKSIYQKDQTDLVSLGSNFQDLKGRADHLDTNFGQLEKEVKDAREMITLVRQDVRDLVKLANLRASSIRPGIKYREPNDAVQPQTITVSDLFGWPSPKVVAPSNAPLDERENSVLRITGDVYAAEVDGGTGTIRVLISEPAKSVHTDRTVILAVPDPAVAAAEGVRNAKLYADAQAALLALLGKTREELPKGPSWEILGNLHGSRRVTAIGYAQYNRAYASRTANGAKIGVWQVSPVWHIQQ